MGEPRYYTAINDCHRPCLRASDRDGCLQIAFIVQACGWSSRAGLWALSFYPVVKMNQTIPATSPLRRRQSAAQPGLLRVRVSKRDEELAAPLTERARPRQTRSDLS